MLRTSSYITYIILFTVKNSTYNVISIIKFKFNLKNIVENY